MDNATKQDKILIVDDELGIRRMMSKRLTRAGHECIEAAGTDELIDKIKEYQPQLVILDIKMPGKSGQEILPEIMAAFPGTAVIMATSVADPNVIIDCMRNGAQDYIMKPVDLEDIAQIAEKALARSSLERKIREFQDNLEEEVANQKRETQRLFLNSIESLVFALEAKDHYTAGHSRRVARIAVAIAEEMGLPAEEIDNIRLGALLHDTGKIAIDHNIINKPGKLTEEEYRHVMTHASIGAGIVKPVVTPQILEIIVHHHDFFNGRGFDQHISGCKIPMGARIITVADSYDAMTSDRPYRNGMSGELGLQEVLRCSGSQFDPEVVAAFKQVHLRGIWDSVL